MKNLREKAKQVLRFSVYLVLFTSIVMSTSYLTMVTMEQFTNRFQYKLGLPYIVGADKSVDYLVKDPIVRVHSGGSFVCSGFVAGIDYVVTAAHCVENLHQILEIYLADGTFLSQGEVVGVDDSQDIALVLTKTGTTIKPAKSDFTGAVSGESRLYVIMCGFPAGQRDQLCTRGVITGNYYFKRHGTGILYQGMSGGPVYSSSTGVVIAVNSAVGRDGVIIGPLVGLPEKFYTEAVESGN